MIRKTALLFALVLFCQPLTAHAEDGFVPLFDGKTLDGWEQHGGKAKYEVKDGAIVGTSVPNTANSFLCTKKTYRNFVLEYDFKVNTELNSGVQFRSNVYDAEKTYEVAGKTIKVAAGRVHGYQCEIDNDPHRKRWWTAGVYDEGRSGWLYPGRDGGNAAEFTKQGEKVIKPEDWNHVRVECNGDHIVTHLNGELRADLHDAMTAEGFIALQVHGVGKKDEPLWVMWKNLQIKELPDTGAALPQASTTTALTADDAPAAAPDADGWITLFNGKDLTGWHNPYKYGKAWVEDGTIHLESGQKFFLVTDKQYSDFELEAQIMLPTTGHSNSGIMFRCHADPNKVYGYQAECDPSDRAWTGGLYDEGRRGWLHPGKDHPKDEHLVKAPLGEWIKYHIIAKGDHIQIFINDQQTTDYHDSTDASGYIGIQHHGEGKQVYQFRNIRIKPLN
ncbi:MAG: DUF1080 domain-containing protein [Planctomycetes bacterium]|nr:DUF1080 domain-containing protein [Planctomycetota bacterium]